MLERRVAAVAAVIGAPNSLVAAVDVVTELGVTAAAYAGLAVWQQGCSQAPVHPAGLLLMASRFGLDVPWTMSSVSVGEQVARLVGSAEGRRLVVRRLVRALYAAPATSVDGLAGELGIDRDVVVALLASRPTVVRSGEWVLVLDPHGWGRIGSPVVRLLRLGPTSLTRLSEGLTRALRWRGTVPPQQGLAHWLGVQPWISVTTSGRYRLRYDPSAPVRSDTVLVDVLAGRRTPVPRKVLEEALVAAGYTEAAAPMLVTVSPILRTAGNGSALRLAASQPGP